MSEIKKTIQQIREWGKKVCATRKTAIDSLVRAGICDENGKLKPEFGGDETADLAAARATIEKQRKVIAKLASLVHRRCLHCANRGSICEGTAEAHCIRGVIAYAEKQVEEGK